MSISQVETPFLSLAAPWIVGLTPYIPGKPVAELERELGISHSVKLASNENPFGPGLRAREAINAVLSELGRYPDGAGFELRRTLGEYHGLAPTAVTLGNGSNDVLDLIARVFLQPGAESVFSEHAFAVYPLAIQSVGATARIAKARDYGHDLDAMAQLVTDATRVVWIANPNNPTGTWLAAAPLKSFIGSLPKRCIVVVDEAYTEYVAEPEFPDATHWVETFPNLIVTRTFSKAHGLAALRVGYALSDPRLADLLNRVRQPFNVNVMAQVAATAAINDREHVRASVELNQVGMKQLTSAFARLGLSYIPSVGNFVTVDCGRPAAPLNEALLKRGVIVRPVANYGMPNHLRISIGLESENARFIAAFEDALA